MAIGINERIYSHWGEPGRYYGERSKFGIRVSTEDRRKANQEYHQGY